MRFLAVLIVVAASAQTDPASILKDRRDREDKHWAQISGLSVSDVQALRQMAGITDPAVGPQILSLDAQSLKARNHILFAEQGNGHCLRVHVVERNGRGFTEVCSLSETPRPVWSPVKGPGNGICSQAPKGPSAHGTAEGRIVVEVPILSDPFLRNLPVSTYTFTWNGSKYELVDEDQEIQRLEDKK